MDGERGAHDDRWPSTDSRHYVLDEAHQLLVRLRGAGFWWAPTSTPTSAPLDHGHGAGASRSSSLRMAVATMLTALKAHCNSVTCASLLDLSVVVAPFVRVMRSPAASGPFTGVALASLRRLFDTGLFRRDCVNAGAAVCEVADAVTHTRFAHTDPSEDDAVFVAMLDVSMCVVECDAGTLLTDRGLWEIFRTALAMAGNAARSPVLRSMATRTVERLVAAPFRRVHELVDVDRSLSTNTPLRSASPRREGDAAALPGVGDRQVSAHSTASSASVGTAASAPIVEEGGRPFGVLALVKLFGALCSELEVARREAEGIAAGTPEHALRDGEAAILGRVTMLLTLIHAALKSAGRGVGLVPPLLDLVRNELCLQLLGVAASPPSQAAFARVLAVVQTLFINLRHHVKMQMEMIFQRVFVKTLATVVKAAKLSGADSGAAGGATASPGIAGGAGDDDDDGGAMDVVAVNEAELALSCLTDLMSTTDALVDLFVNYDCDSHSTDVLSEILHQSCACVLATAEPLADPLACYAVQTLLACVRQLSFQNMEEVAAGVGLVDGDGHAPPPPAPDASTHAAPATGAGGAGAGASAGASAGAGGVATPHMSVPHPGAGYVEQLIDGRRRKQLFRRSAALFAQKPKHCWSFLQQVGLMPSPPSTHDIAHYLRTTPGLDKPQVGAVLGSGEDHELRRAFFAMFDYTGQPLLSSLRMVLQSFWLPGEGQQIDRIVQVFAETCCEKATDARLYPTVDCAYLFSFAIIMLNTNLHNANVKDKLRMSPTTFIKQNKYYGEDINKGRELPEDLLLSVYNSILANKIKPPLTGVTSHGELTADLWRDLLTQQQAITNNPASPHAYKPCATLPAHTRRRLSRLVLRELWEPATKALVASFRTAKDSVVAEELLEGFAQLAALAVDHALPNGTDYVLATLCRLTTLLDAPSYDDEAEAIAAAQHGHAYPSRLPALHAFGAQIRPQMAVVAAFELTRRYGDHTREGWRWLLHALLRLYRLGLVPPELSRSAEDEDLLRRDQRLQFQAHLRAVSAAAREPAASASSGGLLSWLWGSPQPAATPNRRRRRRRVPDADRGTPGSSADLLSDSDSDSDEGDGPGMGMKEAVRQVWVGTAQPGVVPAWALDGSIADAVACARACRLEELVADTCYLSEPSLRALVSALVHLARADPDSAGGVATSLAASLSAASSPAAPVVLAASTTSGSGGGGDAGATDGSATAVAAPAPPASPAKGAATQGEGQPQSREETLPVVLPYPPAAPGSRSSMSTLALRLLTEVALRNRDRIDLVWTPVQNAFMRVMDTATEVNTRVEAAVTGVLRLAIRLLSRPTGSTNVLSSLAPLTRLPPAVAAHLRPHIAGGLAQVLSSAAANVSDHGGWGLIFTLLEQCADHRDASEVAFNALRMLLCDPQLRACVPLSSATPLTAFVRSTAGGTARPVAALELLYTLHERLLTLLPAPAASATSAAGAGAGGGDAAAMNGRTSPEGGLPTSGRTLHVKVQVWLSGWLPVLQAMRVGCQDPRPEVSLAALGVLERCLLDTSGALLAPQHWRRVFDELVLPMVAAVAEAGAASRDASSTRSLEGVVSLLTKVFLRHVGGLATLPNFHELYVQVLRLCERVHSAGVTATVQAAVADAVFNIVRAMKSQGMFEAGDDTTGREMWELTLAIVEPFSPGLEAAFRETAPSPAPPPTAAAGATSTATSAASNAAADEAVDGSVGTSGGAATRDGVDTAPAAAETAAASSGGDVAEASA